MANNGATSSDSQNPALQNTLDEIENQLESKYRLSTIHQGEAVYLVQQETGDGFRINFSNETSINLDKDVFGQDLTEHINRLFESTSEPRELKIREKFSTPPQTPNTSQNETTQEFVPLSEFRDFVKKIEEYQRMLLKEVKGVGDIVKRGIQQQQQSRVQSNSPNFQRIRQFQNLQQHENEEISQFLTTKGFGSKDKSACKSALLADNILRESIAEQRKDWDRRQIQESGSDDWDVPQQQILPSQKGFRQSSQQNFSGSQSNAKNQRPGDQTNPLAVRDQCAKCGFVGHWSSNCPNQDKANCYKPFYHLAGNRNSKVARPEWNKRQVEDDDNSANKRFRTTETMPRLMDNMDYRSQPSYGPTGPDNYQSRGFGYDEPEVTRNRQQYTDSYNPDQYAGYQQQYNNSSGQYGQRYSGGWSH